MPIPSAALRGLCGNLLDDGSRTFTYDAANRLTSVTSGTLTTAFEYDGLGNRVAQTVDGVETRYALDTSAGLSAGVAGGLPEVIVATTDGASTYYVQIQGQILGQEESGTWVYVLPDHLPAPVAQAQVGSVRQLVDSEGQVALAQSYDPFGVRFEASGSGASDFGYTGEWWGSYNDLLFLRARYYDPAVGRFLSKDRFTGFDTLPQTQHSFAYVTNNPANRVDPSGYAGGPAGQAVQLCLRSAPTCASLLAAGATILLELGPWVLIAVPVAYIITHPAPVTEPDVFPEPVPEAQDYYQPYPDTETTTELLDDWANVANNAWDNWQPEPERGRTPIAAPFDPRWKPATPPATCTPDNEYGYEVLTVGDGNFSYSISLHTRHSDWKITGTNYGNGNNSQNFVSSSGQLSLYTNVDATKLEIGPVTGQHQYDAIVFNAPRAEGASVWRKGVSGDLVDAVLRSAQHVLKPGGQMRFSSSGGMPATPRLQQRVRAGERPPGYNSAYKGSLYFADPEGFGVPYQPIGNEGKPLNVDWDDMFWYVFVK